jgi:hypothetical protein
MAEIRALINKCIETLNESKDDLFAQIEAFVKDAEVADNVSHFLFHIDDRSWYTVYFHHCDKAEMLSDDELRTPKFLETAAKEAADIGNDEDGDDENTFFEEVNDVLVGAIAKCWKNADGPDLGLPAYITFHDSDYYYDIAKDEAFSEDDLEGIIN